jgi:hypothetical protein
MFPFPWIFISKPTDFRKMTQLITTREFNFRCINTLAFERTFGVWLPLRAFMESAFILSLES